MGRPKAKYNFLKIYIENTRYNQKTGCIEWLSTILPNGYGKMSVNNTTTIVSRFNKQQQMLRRMLK